MTAIVIPSELRGYPRVAAFAAPQTDHVPNPQTCGSCQTARGASRPGAAGRTARGAALHGSSRAVNGGQRQSAAAHVLEICRTSKAVKTRHEVTKQCWHAFMRPWGSMCQNDKRDSEAGSTRSEGWSGGSSMHSTCITDLSSSGMVHRQDGLIVPILLHACRPCIKRQCGKGKKPGKLVNRDSSAKNIKIVRDRCMPLILCPQSTLHRNYWSVTAHRCTPGQPVVK